MSGCRENMTDAMLQVYDGFEEAMEKECLHCVAKLNEIKNNVNFSLPQTTERGTPVIHSARMEIYKIQKYWYSRLHLAMGFVSREFQEEYGLWQIEIR